jgi:hypothetical protein
MKITTMIAATMIMLIAPHHAAAQQPSDFEIKLQNCKTEALMAEMPGKTRWNSCGQTVPPTPPDALSAKNKASAKRCWTNGRHERTRTPPPAWKKLSIHNEPTFETPRTSSARRLQVRHAARAAARDGDAPAEERWVFCGEPVVPGKSYCLTHCMACRQTLAVARRQSEFLRPQQAEAVRKYLAKAG